MALAHTILATLGDDAFSGYDLWKKFSKCTTHYWQASQQQVYRELTKLQDLEAIAVEIVTQDGRPNKKLYRITPEGKKILLEWIAKPSEPTAIREEVLVKVLAAHLTTPATIIAELQRRHQIHSDNLAALKAQEQESFANESQLSLEKKCMYLTLRRGIRYETEWIAWCEEAIAMFQKQVSK
ncbi:MAG: PadR family transcriptional regulator [Cyanobacteria bacterium P01_G01_bin.67]